MKRTTVWDLAFAVAFACASLLLCRVGWKIVAHGDSAADFWAAIGALATAAAAIIALGIALRDSSKRRTEEDTKAAIAAARLGPMLVMVIGQLTAGRERMAVFLTIDAAPQQFAAAIHVFDQVALDLSLDDLIAIAPLPNKCAERIASGLAEIELIRHMLKTGQHHFSERGDPAERRKLAIATTGLAASALNGLTPAMHQCYKSARIQFGMETK